jgi:hypothetical protein
VVIYCATRLDIKNYTFCTQCAFVCFVSVSERSVILSPNRVKSQRYWLAGCRCSILAEYYTCGDCPSVSPPICLFYSASGHLPLSQSPRLFFSPSVNLSYCVSPSVSLPSLFYSVTCYQRLTQLSGLDDILHATSFETSTSRCHFHEDRLFGSQTLFNFVK